MNTTSFAPRATLVLGTLVAAACAQTEIPRGLTPAPAAELATIARAPQNTGERIYEGRVYSLDSTRIEPLFRYDRRVRDDGATVVSTHITRDVSGATVVTQTAVHDASYTIRRASMIQAQSGLKGTVDVVGDRLHFTLTKDGTTTSADEGPGAPLVAGPTMFGFIGQHWDELTTGRRVPVRFAVLERNRSYEFVLERTEESADRVTIRMTASNWLVRRIVAPTSFYFDARTKTVVGYDGRVPPLETVGSSLRPLDARVRYTQIAAAFR